MDALELDEVDLEAATHLMALKHRKSASLPTLGVLQALDHQISQENFGDIPTESIYGQIGSTHFRQLSAADQVTCRQAMAFVARSVQIRGPEESKMLPKVCPCNATSS